MLKILQVRLQQYVNWELPDVQAGFFFFKVDFERQRNQRSNYQRPLNIEKKKQEFQKNIYFCRIDYRKAFDYVDHNKLWKILQEMGIQTTLPASWEICI